MDGRLTVQHQLDVTDQLKAAGVTTIGLVTDPREEP